MVSESYIKKALEWNAKRISTLEPMDVDNLIVGCGQIVAAAGGSFASWVSRRDRFKALKSKRLTKAKQRALADLVEYTQSCIDACNWVEDWTLGALPTKSEPSSDPNLSENRRKASQAAAEGRRRAREAREAALAQRIDFDSH